MKAMSGLDSFADVVVMEHGATNDLHFCDP